MIEVLMQCGSGVRNVRTIEIKGHGGGKKQEDILCAAVSALVQMTAYSIRDVLKIPARIKFDDGYCRISIPGELEQEQTRGLAVIVESLGGTLEGFIRKYPGRIRMKTQ